MSSRTCMPRSGRPERHIWRGIRTCALGTFRASVFHFRMAKHSTRRNFLRAAPIAAAASIALPDKLLFALANATGQGPPPTPVPFTLFTAEKLADSLKAFQTDLGEHYLYQPKVLPMTIAITAQNKSTGKEFEYHEGRDHIFLILDGATKFELGGTPTAPRNVRPGEWLAAGSEGATAVEVKKGDMLLVPR